MFLLEQGFLNTKAPFFLDLITIYFAFLPILLAISIRFAIKKEYKKHLTSQSIILFFTLFMIIIFETGVRITGGFIEFSKESTLVSYSFLLSFLIIHIIIAIFSVAGWLYLYIYSYKLYKNNQMEKLKSSKHKKIGKYIFLCLTLTSYMGVAIYILLFF